MPLTNTTAPRQERIVGSASAAPLAALLATALLACGSEPTGPARIARVAVTPGTATLTALGASQQFEAEATDAKGNVIAGAELVWRSHDTSVATVTSSGLVTGRALGTTTITASAGGVEGHALLTVDQVVAGLGFLGQPSDVAAGAAITPAITLELLDAGGHRVSDGTASVTLALDANPGGATLGGTRTVASVAGIATFSDMWLDRAAPGYTLAASAGEVAAVTSAAFAVTPGAVELAFLTHPGTAEGQVSFDPAIQVAAREDRFGNTVPDVAVTIALAVSPTGEALRGTTTVTAVNGVATFAALRLSQPGDGFILEARSGAAAPARSAAFSVRLSFVAVSAGGHHTCGITVAESVYCWGMNRDGQLGDGTTIDRRTPVSVTGGLRFAQVSAGGSHTCAVATDGAGYCWGFNHSGRLGDGTTDNLRPNPTPVAGGLTFAQVSAGDSHTCAITIERAAYCWGWNGAGQLGDGSVSDRLTATPVGGGLTFAQIGAGFGQSCGVTTGNVGYCWGRNETGQLGDGTTTQRETPSLLAGGLSFVRLTAGFQHSCGVTTDNHAYCWGDNFFGQLGDGYTDQRLRPTPVAGTLAFADVTARFTETCGSTAGNVAYCWGRNSSGQGGDGTADQRNVPTAVDGGLSFAHVSLGHAHACGLTTGNVVYCWGDNYWGQSGHGAAEYSLTPLRVVQ